MDIRHTGVDYIEKSEDSEFGLDLVEFQRSERHPRIDVG